MTNMKKKENIPKKKNDDNITDRKKKENITKKE